MNRRSLTLALFAALVALAPAAFPPVEAGPVEIRCMAAGDDCRKRLAIVPDGQPGQILKFEFCRASDCHSRAYRDRWTTHYLVPPPGEVCRNADVGEALRWLEQNRPGWLLAGWGCVSSRQLPV